MQDYGRFKRNDQVGDAFRNGSVPQELNYFYAGWETMPYAIMGIDPSYAVSSRLWVAFQPESALLRKMSTNMYGEDRYEPYGFNILGPDGEVIGIWFSSLHFPSVKVDRDKRRVNVRYKNPESDRYY